MKNKTAEEILDQFPGTVEYPQLLTRLDAEQACELYADQFKPKWIPVEDRLPEVIHRYDLIECSGEVQIWSKSHGCQQAWLKRFVKDCSDRQSPEKVYGYYLFECAKGRYTDVTHWMPLPSAPERKEVVE